MSRPRVKICGVTRVEDAELAARLGADAVGFVLWSGSPRHVSPEAVASIGKILPPFVARVGVVVDMSPDDVAATVRRGGLDIVQLHGDEQVERYTAIAARLIKAVPAETDEDVARALALPAEVTVLVDAADRMKRGGTGQRANWARAAEIARARRLILAGGLNAENVAEAVASVHPWGIDVSSGVEEVPGVKNSERMTALFEALA